MDPRDYATPVYDVIGRHYTRGRREDPRIAEKIHAELNGARSVVNVGAGAGAYEPRNRRVVAVEPSRVMIDQRPTPAAPAVCAIAEELPFADDAFDAAMGVLTVHHWTDKRRGLSEMRRVSRGPVVLLMGDVQVTSSWWLPAHYFPATARLTSNRIYTLDQVAAVLGDVDVITVPIPADCRDGFEGAYWRRPHEILDPDVWGAVSIFQQISDDERNEGMRRLSDDLESGEWMRRFGHLTTLDELDVGYRLVVARP